MDTYQQPQHRYMLRPPAPPPPSTADPHYQYHNQHHLHQQSQARPSAVPPPQGQSWYSNQFQYPQSQSPPPHQWGNQPAPPPPPHAEHLHQPHSSSYPPPPPTPYQSHPQHPAVLGASNNNNQFPPPPGLPRPLLPPHSHISQPQPHPQVNQEWSNPNWGHRQDWDYQAHNNVEDWGARAREWAASKAAVEDQHPQSQFTPASRPEEQSRYQDPYPQLADSRYQDFQQQSLPASGYQQFPIPAAPLHRETTSVSSGPSYVPDGHQSYPVRFESPAGDFSARFSHQESMSTTSAVHQQEVPSSYSSIAGKEDVADQKEQSFKSLPLPFSSGQEGQHYMLSSFPPPGRSVYTEQAYAYGHQPSDPANNDRPLDFVPKFNPEHDPHIRSSYATHQESVGTRSGNDLVPASPSISSWTPPAAPGMVYPPIPSAIPPGPQHDPSITSGHALPPFGRFHGPNFPNTVPSVGAPFGLSAGPTVSPAAFLGDTYGLSNLSDRPKKASVPNWLKEEIIKNKAAISKTSLEHPKEETQSFEDEGADNNFGKNDQADSKSIDSSRSIGEEDDDDEVDVETAKTAAINQEIKRILTEVLLTVTDELFDEIATKVIGEDELTAENELDTFTTNHKVSSTSLAIPTHMSSAKIIVPGEPKDSRTESVVESSISGAPGDLLGLANYASDDDADADNSENNGDETRTSSVTNPKIDTVLEQRNNHTEDMHDSAENGSSKVKSEEHISVKTSTDDLSKTRAGDLKKDDSNEHAYSSKVASGNMDDEGSASSRKVIDGTTVSRLNENLREENTVKAELNFGTVSGKKSTTNGNISKEPGLKLGNHDQRESRKSSGKDTSKDDTNSFRADDNSRREDDKHLKKEKTENRNGSKEKSKDGGVKPADKAKESDSRRKSSHLDSKEERKEPQRSHRTVAAENTNRKRERKEEDRSRHKVSSDSTRSKRRRSPSISNRGRNSKDNLASHANGSSDDSSNDSKRKVRSRKRNLSPSPVRSRRRQVSRSPHSKHSQRRHSPYSSLERTRRKTSRSRSRSPVQRRR